MAQLQGSGTPNDTMYSKMHEINNLMKSNGAQQLNTSAPLPQTIQGSYQGGNIPTQANL